MAFFELSRGRNGYEFKLKFRRLRLSRFYERKTFRAWLFGFAAGISVALLLKMDLSPLVDHFYAQKVERRVVDVWMRRAVQIDYRGCKERPKDCVGHVVAWRISHLAKGDTRYQDDASNPIIWRNEAQVPITISRGSQFLAVAIVADVSPNAIDLTFLGTPDAVYGGTTWKRKFGLLDDVPTPPAERPIALKK